LQVGDLTKLEAREEEVLIPVATLPSQVTSTIGEMNVLAEPSALPFVDAPPTQEQEKPLVENDVAFEEVQEINTSILCREQTQIYPPPRNGERPFGLPEVILTPNSPACLPLERVNKVDSKTSSPKLSPIFNLESKLHQLQEMGFGNEAQNIELLTKHNGDLLITVKDLIELC